MKVILILSVLVLTACGVQNNDPAKAQREKAALDSMTAASGAAAHRHDSLMLHNKPYRDSVKRADAIEAKASAERAQILLDQERETNPAKFIKVSTNWHKGGFGSVALVKVKVDNKSLKNCVNPIVAVTFFANGEALNIETQQVFETFPSGKQRSSKEINFGFINSQVTAASAEIMSATWE